ncbi:PD40 domain-containing protein [Sandaracinus amylolyticus]|uniref:OmpA family protein n=1 Tax=Sandaracinus amylolyticus TaxID=927083 RepID=A0A0F6W0I3_9BACT|nr:PD40 domain-containing protein [Sandaracinus amylolyticus]AKF04362.1 OmpA family protein [Sandaracinus amylolyticus]
MQFARRSIGALTLVLVALATPACGRVGYQTSSDAASPAIDAAPPDATTSDASWIGIDAGPPVPEACRFGTPEWVGAVATSGQEHGPTITANRRVLCFASNRPGGVGRNDVYCIERAAASAPWGTVTAYPVVNSSADDVDPALTPDGWEMIYASDRAGGAGGLDLYHAEFDSRAYTFLPPTRIDALSTPDHEGGAEVAADGVTIYFTRRPIGGGPTRLYVTRRTGTGLTFDEPTEMAELASEHHDTEPTISADGRTLVWCSDRPVLGRASLSYNLWCAQHDGSAWGPPIFVDGAALDAGDPCSPEFASDGSLFFTSGVLPGASGLDVFRAPPAR